MQVKSSSKIGIMGFGLTRGDILEEFKRRGVSLEQSIMSFCYILYGLHKKYPIVKQSNGVIEFQNLEDDLLTRLWNASKHDYLDMIYDKLCQVSYEDFEREYKSYIRYYYEYLIYQKEPEYLYHFGDTDKMDYIGRIISLFLKENSCKSVFDPFCNYSFLYLNEDFAFSGQDLSEITTIMAMIYSDMIHGVHGDIKQADSLKTWNDGSFDAVVSVLPFNKPEESYRSGFFYKDIVYANRFFKNAFELNHAKVAIALLPISFCYSSEFYELRKSLIENNLIESICHFPNQVLPQTSIPTVIVVCQANRIDKSVYYYNLEMESAKPSDEIELVEASIDEIRNYDYNLYPYIYTDEIVACDSEQKRVTFADILVKADYVDGRKKDLNSVEIAEISTNLFSRNSIEIWKNKKSSPHIIDISQAISKKVYFPVEHDVYLLISGGPLKNAQFALYAGKDAFSIASKFAYQVMKINTELVDPDYLVYRLVNDPVLKKIYMPFSSCMNLQIGVDDLQKQSDLVAKERQLYVQRIEREAEEKRFGVMQNVSDLQHMLGPTQMKINRIISRLEKMTPDSENYKRTVKDLRDNIGYQNRLIKYSYSHIDSASFDMTSGDIADFMQQYIEAWSNYGGNYFKIRLQDNLDEKISVTFDRTMMTVLFDSILTNAARHGFHKNSEYTDENLVNITLSLQSVHGEPCVVISVANNGDKFKDGFDISDYITKGRFTSDSGRSGLGGYHVHQIVKGHHGYMYIDSNIYWNVIIDIILPIDNKSINNLNQYEHECI